MSILEVIFNAVEAANHGFSGVCGKCTLEFRGLKEVKKETKRDVFMLPELWICGSQAPKTDRELRGLRVKPGFGGGLL